MLLVNQLIGFGAFSSDLVTSTVRTDTLNADSGGWNGYNFRLVFDAAGLTAPGGSLTQIRFTLNAGSAEGFAWDDLYVGHKAAAGDAMDFAATPVQVMVAGVNSGSLAAGASVVTDWAAFGWNQTSGIILAFRSGAVTDTVRALDSATNVNTYLKLGASESATVDVVGAGYTTGTVELQFVSKIEVR